MRRSPKYGVFLLLGAAVGVLVALVLTFSFHGTDQVSPNSGLQFSVGQVFGFVLLVCVVVGVTLAGLVALLLDRIVGRRTREIAATSDRIREVD